METFQDVLKSIQTKGRKRQFHLLLGNGFSMAYDPEIFSYTALHEFITDLNDADLSTVLEVVETKNFELIMQQLDTFSALIDAFGGNEELKEKIDNASTNLKNGLISAVEALHPEHVFQVPEEQSDACASFLSHFLSTNGSIFSTNYDLLLYWVLLRNQESTPHCDGFGREVENLEEVAQGEAPQYSDLRWGKNRDDQNVFYVHGALPFFDTGIDVIKEVYNSRNFILENIHQRMESGEYPVFVTAGDGRQKLAHIMHNQYLTWCYEHLSSIEGSLVTFGFNFGKYDEHIIDAINIASTRSKPGLLSIYIGVYSDEDEAHIKKIQHRFLCKKVHIFDAKTVDVWGKSET